MTNIGEICNREVVHAVRDTPIVIAAKLMRQHHVGSVVIVDEVNGGKRVPVGIVTDRHLVVEILATGLDPRTMTFGDVMVPELVTARDSEGLSETMEIMRYKSVRRLPIVGEEGQLVGIVSVDGSGRSAGRTDGVIHAEEDENKNNQSVQPDIGNLISEIHNPRRLSCFYRRTTGCARSRSTLTIRRLAKFGYDSIEMFGRFLPSSRSYLPTCMVMLSTARGTSYLAVCSGAASWPSWSARCPFGLPASNLARRGAGMIGSPSLPCWGRAF